MDKTNKERLASIETAIINIDTNFREFKNGIEKDNKEQWRYINRNAQSISGIKGASAAIAFITTILTTLGVYFGVIKQ